MLLFQKWLRHGSKTKARKSRRQAFITPFGLDLMQLIISCEYYAHSTSFVTDTYSCISSAYCGWLKLGLDPLELLSCPLCKGWDEGN